VAVARVGHVGARLEIARIFGRFAVHNARVGGDDGVALIQLGGTMADVVQVTVFVKDMSGLRAI